MSHVRIKEGKFQVNTLPRPVEPNDYGKSIHGDNESVDYKYVYFEYESELKAWNADVNWVNVRDEDEAAVYDTLLADGHDAGKIVNDEWVPELPGEYEVNLKFGVTKECKSNECHRGCADCINCEATQIAVIIPSTEEEKTRYG